MRPITWWSCTSQGGIQLIGKQPKNAVAKWEHASVAKEFIDLFTNRGFKFSAKDSRDYQDLLDRRSAADYHDVYLDQRRAERSLNKARSLCERLREELEG